MTTGIDFVLDYFSASYTLATSASMFAGSFIQLDDVSATAVYYISKTDINNVFKFEADSWDFNDISAADIRYFIDMESWPSDLRINPVNAMLDKNDSAYAMLQVGIPEKMLVKHDFIRYLAKKLFNTANGVDLFNNEVDLLTHLNTMGAASFNNDISGTLWKYATTSSLSVNDSTFILDLSSNKKCTTDNLTSNDNICRELFNQILYNNKVRFADVTFDAVGQASLPINAGDSISYRFTVFPAANQHLLTGVDAFGGRSYRIKLLVVENASGLNTTPTETATNSVTYTKI